MSEPSCSFDDDGRFLVKTLITEHWAGQLRGAGNNAATRVSPIVRLPARDLRALFECGYPMFVGRCRAIDEPGVAIVAVDELTGDAAGMAILRARVDRHVTAIVGRHDRCDLYLAGNERLALRQLAVVLAPVTDWPAGSSTVNVRIVDLRTSEGMLDEHGRPLRGLRSEGSAMVRCGGYAVFVLPLGDSTDWPDSASDAWLQLPERVYVDELVRVPDASLVSPQVRMPAHITRVTRTAGPRTVGMRLGSVGDRARQLWLRGACGECVLDVGYQALREGILLGRYARCDGFGIAHDESLSRVHALLMSVDERLLVIDVASTNGTRLRGGRDARVFELDDRAELELAGAAYARWTWWR